MQPLLSFIARPWARQPNHSARRRRVDIPTETPSTDAIFLILRRMRMPLIVLITVFTVSVAGLTLMPGVDDQGNPYRMSVFDAFYFISYTATTIGFGETPYTFTIPQRMWVTGSIYATVLGWAYTFAALYGLVQDNNFRDAVAHQRFARRVRRLTEPFVIVGGYGQSGELVCRELAEAGRRFVVIDVRGERIDALGGEQLGADVPGIEADARNPGVLGLAGLAKPNCEGLLALTNDDNTNLAMVMAANLLRPELPVIARCGDRAVEEHMHDFAAEAVINPNDRYGGYLVLAMQRPTTYQLVKWLMAPEGTELPERTEGLGEGPWVVCADGQFGEEVSNDLRTGGLEVICVDPADGDPDVASAAGFVAGTDDDTTNIALAEHARQHNDNLFVCVRQQSTMNQPLLDALDVHSVFIATDLVARESLARVVTPVFRSFVDHALEQPEEWAQALIDRLVDRCDTTAPRRDLYVLDGKEAPAAHRWMTRGRDLTLRDLLRDPDDREQPLAIVPLMLIRGTEVAFTPDESVRLEPGDQLLLAGRPRALGDLSEGLFYDSVIEHLATGANVPDTWLWRKLSKR
ncbi:NAD-binding protein [Actinomycetota bacterium]